MSVDTVEAGSCFSSKKKQASMQTPALLVYAAGAERSERFHLSSEAAKSPTHSAVMWWCSVGFGRSALNENHPPQFPIRQIVNVAVRILYSDVAKILPRSVKNGRSL